MTLNCVGKCPYSLSLKVDAGSCYVAQANLVLRTLLAVHPVGAYRHTQPKVSLFLRDPYYHM